MGDILLENIHDKNYRRILSNKKQFLNFLKSSIDLPLLSKIRASDLEIIDKEFINENETDIIYKLKFEDKEIVFYCLFNLQSAEDYSTPFMLLDYITELYRRMFHDACSQHKENKSFKLPEIIPIVLCSGVSERTTVRNFRECLNGYEFFEN